MKFISWNVNGFRAVLNKGFDEIFSNLDADFFSLQETKMKEGQASFAPEGYTAYYAYAEKAGYSGTAIFAKKAANSVSYGINGKHTDEGRVITLEYDSFYLVNAYVPNAQDELRRIDYRMEFEDDMRAYLLSLSEKKSVVYCGDLNVAHKEIDIKNAKANIGKAGFSYEERGKMTELLESGFLDSFRELHPEEIKYSWWSYRFRARENNAGWRLDYFLISKELLPKVREAEILNDIMGSDHCPVLVDIDI
jgi:exodeoxyribonuclease-3